MSSEGQCSLMVSVPYLMRLKYGLLHGVHSYVDLWEGCMLRTSCTMSLQICSVPYISFLVLSPFFTLCVVLKS